MCIDYVSSFPSPYGDCISQMVTVPNDPELLVRFPSPCGDCISQMIMVVSWVPITWKRFRPLTGTAFLKSGRWNTLQILPSGLFPSPCGDCISQIRFFHAFSSRSLLVSVPSRGLHFSNGSRWVYQERNKKVSVPSRGLHFSNATKWWYRQLGESFPSPHGDCISQIGTIEYGR